MNKRVELEPVKKVFYSLEETAQVLKLDLDRLIDYLRWDGLIVREDNFWRPSRVIRNNGYAKNKNDDILWNVEKGIDFLKERESNVWNKKQ